MLHIFSLFLIILQVELQPALLLHWSVVLCLLRRDIKRSEHVKTIPDAGIVFMFCEHLETFYLVMGLKNMLQSMG